MEIVVHSKKSVSTKVSKEIVPFKSNRTISIGIPNFRVWCKRWSNWTSGVGQKIWLPVLLGIRLHPKTSDSLWLRNSGFNLIATLSCSK